MKKVVNFMVSVALALLMMLSISIQAFAVKYPKNVMNEQFENAETCDFSAPGDFDDDKTVTAEDMRLFRSILLTNQSSAYAQEVSTNADAKYWDVNGDEAFNIVDLIRMKKIALRGLAFIGKTSGSDSTGGMNLYGKTCCKQSLQNKLTTGVQYQISFEYQSDTPIRLAIAGFDTPVVFNAAASDTWKSASFSFTTPLEMDTEVPVNVQLVGQGKVDNISIVRISMDNEFSVKNYG